MRHCAELLRSACREHLRQAADRLRCIKTRPMLEPGKIVLFMEHEIPQQRGRDASIEGISIHDLRRKNTAWGLLLRRKELKEITFLNRHLRIKLHLQNDFPAVVLSAEFSVCE